MSWTYWSSHYSQLKMNPKAFLVASCLIKTEKLLQSSGGSQNKVSACPILLCSTVVTTLVSKVLRVAALLQYIMIPSPVFLLSHLICMCVCRLLSVICCNLDSFLLLESQYNISSLLLRSQRENVTQLDTNDGYEPKTTSLERHISWTFAFDCLETFTW